MPGKEQKVNSVLRKFIFCVLLRCVFVVSLAGHSNNIRPRPESIRISPIERRWSNRRFPYGYLVTTSSQLPPLP